MNHIATGHIATGCKAGCGRPQRLLSRKAKADYGAYVETDNVAIFGVVHKLCYRIYELQCNGISSGADFAQPVNQHEHFAYFFIWEAIYSLWSITKPCNLGHGERWYGWATVKCVDGRIQSLGCLSRRCARPIVRDWPSLVSRLSSTMAAITLLLSALVACAAAQDGKYTGALPVIGC